MKKEEIHTTNELAKITGYTPGTIRSYISSGRIRAIKIKRGKYKVDMESLKAVEPKNQIIRKCPRCIYHEPISGWGVSQERGCWYLNKTGKQRGCPVENCTKFKRRKKNANKIPEVS